MWEDMKDNTFERLPNSVALKCTHGCHNCLSREKALNIDKVKDGLGGWMKEK